MADSNQPWVHATHPISTDPYTYGNGLGWRNMMGRRPRRGRSGGNRPSNRQTALVALVVPAHTPWEAPMPAALLCAHLTDEEFSLRTQARVTARRPLPNPAVTPRAFALAICEVEAGLRSASVPSTGSFCRGLASSEPAPGYEIPIPGEFVDGST
jgi:hypothetical protein